jgi:hypothetical protein
MLKAYLASFPYRYFPASAAFGDGGADARRGGCIDEVRADQIKEKSAPGA